jgi:hypothetical protein
MAARGERAVAGQMVPALRFRGVQQFRLKGITSETMV